MRRSIDHTQGFWHIKPSSIPDRFDIMTTEAAGVVAKELRAADADLLVHAHLMFVCLSMASDALRKHQEHANLTQCLDEVIRRVNGLGSESEYGVPV